MTRALRAILALSLFFTGWGWTDAGGFLRNPARCVFAGVLLVFAMISPSHPIFRAGADDTEMPIGHALATLLLVPTLMAGASALAYADRHAILVFHFEWCRWIGLNLFTAGGWIQWLSMRQLGNRYSPLVALQSSHELVQKGIYSRVRHPMYTGLLLALPGIAAIFRSDFALPVAIATAVFVGIRIHTEERMLSARFVAEFESYKQRTKMLIPAVF